MAVVETLEVRFRADMGKLGEQLAQLTARIGGLGRALDAGRASLATSAAGLIQSVADALLNGAGMSAAPENAGNMLAARFSQSILLGKGSAAQAARQVSAAASFSNSGALSAAQSAGAALSQGFANGISSRSGAVMSAVNRVVNAAVSRIRSALQIHSPSKVSFEIGGFFGEGFADGILSSVRMAEASIASLSAGSADALASSASNPVQAAVDAGGFGGMVRSAVDEALGGIELVVPLHVDGMKLGEASIRGINRVTRSAGRLLLEI